jgi:hypothetical protein
MRANLQHCVCFFRALTEWTSLEPATVRRAADDGVLELRVAHREGFVPWEELLAAGCVKARAHRR